MVSVKAVLIEFGEPLDPRGSQRALTVSDSVRHSEFYRENFGKDADGQEISQEVAQAKFEAEWQK